MKHKILNFTIKMSQPIIAAPQIVAMSDNNLAEARRQLKDIMPFKGDPETLHTFVSRVDYVISLHQSEPSKGTKTDRLRDLWDFRTSKIVLPLKQDSSRNLKLKHQTTNFGENFRETPYRGSLRAFCEEAERIRQLLISKLHLEGNQSYFLIYILRLLKTHHSLLFKLITILHT